MGNACLAWSGMILFIYIPYGSNIPNCSCDMAFVFLHKMVATAILDCAYGV